MGRATGRGIRLHGSKFRIMVYRRMDEERVPGGWRGTGRCTDRGDGIRRNAWNF